MRISDWSLDVCSSDLNNPGRQILIVNNEEGKLAGLLKIRELQFTKLPDSHPIKELVNEKIIYVYPESQLSFAVEMMDRYKTDLIPVVNKNDKTHAIGLLTPSLVFAAYRKTRHANEKLQRTINLKRSGYKFLLRSRNTFRHHQ